MVFTHQSISKWRIALPGCLLSLLLILPTVLTADDDEATLNKVRLEIGKMQKEIRDTQLLRDSVQKEVLTLEIELASLSKELKRVKSKINRQRYKLNKLYNKRKKLKKDLRTQHKLLADQVKSAYMMGHQEYIKIILNLEDTSSIGRTMTYYQYFNQARLDRIEMSRITLASLGAVERKINQQTVLLKETRLQQTTKQKRLKGVTQSRAVIVAQLHAQLQNQETDLSVLITDQRRLQKLINKLDEVIPAILTDPGNRTPFAKLKGKLNWPTKGKLKNIYGKKRRTGRVKWNGIMIMARTGQDVKAVSHGRVAFAEFLRGYGLLLILDHGDGYMSLYGHNQTIYKEIGEWVETGETIASIGTSGGKKHSGLYFEIRYNGKPSNPVRWFRSG